MPPIGFVDERRLRPPLLKQRLQSPADLNFSPAHEPESAQTWRLEELMDSQALPVLWWYEIKGRIHTVAQ